MRRSVFFLSALVAITLSLAAPISWGAVIYGEQQMTFSGGGWQQIVDEEGNMSTYAQTFTPEISGRLVSVDIALTNTSYAGPLDIWLLNTTDTIPDNAGILLSFLNQTLPLYTSPGLVNDNFYTWYNIDLSFGNAWLTQDTRYALMIGPVNNDNKPIRWGFQAPIDNPDDPNYLPDPYMRGSFYTWDPVNEYWVPGRGDAMFSTNMLVPEPGSMLILGLGIAGLGASRLRKRQRR